MLGLNTLVTKPLNFNMLLCSWEDAFTSQPPPPSRALQEGHVVVVRKSLIKFRFSGWREGGGWWPGMMNGRNIQRATRKTNIKPPLSKPTKNKLPKSPLLYSGEREGGRGRCGRWQEEVGFLRWMLTLLRAQKQLCRRQLD